MTPLKYKWTLRNPYEILFQEKDCLLAHPFRIWIECIFVILLYKFNSNSPWQLYRQTTKQKQQQNEFVSYDSMQKKMVTLRRFSFLVVVRINLRIINVRQQLSVIQQCITVILHTSNVLRTIRMNQNVFFNVNLMMFVRSNKVA
jgi:hypothetical protein